MVCPKALHSSGDVRISVTDALWQTFRFRNGRNRTKVDHVERTDGRDLGDSLVHDRLETVRAGGEDTSDELVRELRGREIQDAHEISLSYQPLHGR